MFVEFFLRRLNVVPPSRPGWAFPLFLVCRRLVSSCFLLLFLFSVPPFLRGPVF